MRWIEEYKNGCIEIKKKWIFRYWNTKKSNRPLNKVHKKKHGDTRTKWWREMKTLLSSLESQDKSKRLWTAQQKNKHN